MTIKYIEGLDTEGLCACAHKDILLRFINIAEEIVPVNNISSIDEYVYEEETSTEDIPTEPEVKEVTKVSILGISAEFIRSVIVRLRLYEDGSCCDVTETIPVDMKIGNRYNVTYIDHKSHAIYEIDGVLKAINIDQNFGDEGLNHGFVRHECECNSHDCVGMNNMLYDNCGSFSYDMNHFLSLPKECPEKVSFVFDTSSASKSTFDTIWLVDIRGVKGIGEDGDINIVDPECPECNKPTPPALKYPCCGMCCDNTNFGKCDGCGACCNHNPSNVPNPYPPIPPQPNIPNMPPIPPMPPADFAEPVYVDNFKAYIGVPDDNFFITIEDTNTGGILENINIKDMIAAYIRSKVSQK